VSITEDFGKQRTRHEGMTGHGAWPAS